MLSEKVFSVRIKNKKFTVVAYPEEREATQT